jgi:hypothetical protein
VRCEDCAWWHRAECLPDECQPCARFERWSLLGERLDEFRAWLAWDVIGPLAAWLSYDVARWLYGLSEALDARRR